MVKKRIKQAIVVLASLFLCAVMLFGVAGISNIKAFAAEAASDENVLYLSDTSRIKHATGKAKDGKTDMSKAYNNKIYMKPSYTGNDIPGDAIQAKIENAWYTFENGIYTHGGAYVAFDISKFSDKYKYFSAYVGLLPAASKSDGSWIYVQTSTDGTDTGKWVTQKGDPSVETVGIKQKAAYNQNALHITLDVTGVKWIRLCADVNNTDNDGNVLKGSNAQDYVVWADAKLSTSLEEGEAVKSLGAFDAQIKSKMSNVDLDKIKGDKNVDLFKDNKELELLVLQREFVSRVGQYALKKFLDESNDNKLMFDWLFDGLDSLDNLREFMLGGTPFKGNYYNSLTVLSNLYKSYKNDLSITTKINNKFMRDRTFGELCRTMMFSVALTHDGAIGSYLQGSKPQNASEPLRRYAIFKYMFQTERFVATRNADGSWKSETMNLFGSLRVEEMRWLMCSIIDDESLIWLNDYVQTRINKAPNNVGNLYTPHSYVRYTDPNYNNPVFYANENYDYFNALFSVDSREVKVGNNVIIPDDNLGKKLEDEELIKLSQHPVTNISHYGLWDSEYKVPGPYDPETGTTTYYTMKVSRSGEGETKLQKVWMNFNNKFKTGSVCGGISKSGVNIRTARGIPANVIGQPGHAAILYYSQDANGNGSWKIDNDVGGWLAATKGERHLLGWGSEAWQRNSGGTVVYFHLAQTCLNDYDNLVRAEEYSWLAKVYQGDLESREALYEKALTTQILNLDAWYGLVQTYKANTAKTAADFSTLAGRITDTLWNHPVAMHCLLKLFTVKTNIAEVDAVLTSPVFTMQLKTLEIEALAKAKAQGSTAAKSKVNYLLGLSDTSVADFSFDGENAGCIVWSDTYSDGSFTWKYSIDGKQSWKEVTFNEGDSHAYLLPEEDLAAISPENDIYVYIVGANPDNAYKIDVAAKPALPETVYANDWENRMIGVDGTYEWRYCSATDTATETGADVTYTPVSNWRCFADASPDCTGNKAIEVRLKGTSKNPASDGRIFTFTVDTDTEEKKYISIDYLSVVEFSTESQDEKRPNYAVNAIDGNANTYWHTDYAINIKNPGLDEKGEAKPYAPAFLTVKLDVPRYISCLEFSQRQYNSSFSIFAKKVTVYVSEDGEKWTKAAVREGLENIADLNVVNFEEPVYGQYIKLEMTDLWETNKNDGVFTTLSLLNLYEDTTKTTSPSGETMPSLSDIKPSKDSLDGFGAVVTEEEVAGEELVADEEFVFDSGITAPEKSNAVMWVVLSVVGGALIAAVVVVTVIFIKRRNADE